ncbi:MAG: hypothetical protein SCI25_15960, partial [Desulfuromonadales bacterium]|nr:hypothetical protein [Desulfuromonadales bacterium]
RSFSTSLDMGILSQISVQENWSRPTGNKARERRYEMAKTEKGKKFVKVPAYVKIVEGKTVKVPAHIRSTPN